MHIILQRTAHWFFIVEGEKNDTTIDQNKYILNLDSIEKKQQDVDDDDERKTQKKTTKKPDENKNTNVHVTSVHQYTFSFSSVSFAEWREKTIERLSNQGEFNFDPVGLIHTFKCTTDCVNHCLLRISMIFFFDMIFCFSLNILFYVFS